MRVQDLMTKGVYTIAPDVTAIAALSEMRRHQVHHLVVMEARDIVGVISERDLGGRRRGADAGRTAGELMTPKPVTAPPDMTVRRAANLMRGRSLGSLPVVRDGKLVGILTISDLLDAIGRGDLGRSEHVLSSFQGRRFVANR